MISEEVFSGFGNWKLFRCHFHKVKQPNNRLRGSLILKSNFQNFLEYPKYWDYLEIFQAIWKLSGPSGKYPDYPETFQAIRKLSGPSGKYPAYPENIQSIRKLSWLSENFPDHSENIQAIWKLSRLSGNFPDHPYLIFVTGAARVNYFWPV